MRTDGFGEKIDALIGFLSIMIAIGFAVGFIVAIIYMGIDLYKLGSGK